MGECTLYVRPSVDKDLYAVILACPEVTPCFERRQAFRAVANEDASPSILRLSDQALRAVANEDANQYMGSVFFFAVEK